MSEYRNYLSAEEIIELSRAGKIPQALRDYWVREHGTDPEKLAELIQKARKLERQGFQLIRFGLVPSAGLVFAPFIGALWPNIPNLSWFVALLCFLALVGLIWCSVVLDKRAEVNQALGKSVWAFGGAFAMFTGLIRPVPTDTFAAYSHQGLKDLVEKQLRALARLGLEEEVKASGDGTLPRVMLVSDRSQSLHYDLRQLTEHMKVLGLSDGDFGRYYMLAKRDLK